MEARDYLTIAGWIVAILIGLIGAVPQIKRIRAQNSLDDVQTANSALELVDKYEKRVEALQKRVDHLEKSLEGNLHLVVKIPLADIFLHGSTTINGVTAEIIKASK